MKRPCTIIVGPSISLLCAVMSGCIRMINAAVVTSDQFDFDQVHQTPAPLSLTDIIARAQ